MFFGHIPDADGPDRAARLSLDAGCVFGGSCKAFDSRDGRVHSVPARQAYCRQRDGRRRPATSVRWSMLQAARSTSLAACSAATAADDGRLAIYTYTDACMYDNAWDEVTRNARGHVFDTETGECVAWPFPKFFNLGENPESQPECFPWDQPYEIYEKMDGWLGVLYRHEGRFKVASRGSFHSSGSRLGDGVPSAVRPVVPARRGDAVLRDHPPGAAIILDYRGRSRWSSWRRSTASPARSTRATTVAEWARRIGLPLVPLLGHCRWRTCGRRSRGRQDCEGFVIRFADGRRVKVKTEWYLGIARIMANLTPIAVWEVLRNGKVPLEYLQRVPEELRPLAEKYRRCWRGSTPGSCSTLRRRPGRFWNSSGRDRRALAQHMEGRKELGFRRSAVFLLLDGKRDRLEKIIKDVIYPKGNQFTV